MKKFISLIIAIAALAGSMSAADKVKIGDLYYNLDITYKTAEVTSENHLRQDNYSYLSGSLIIPETVVYQGTTYTVTRIDHMSFIFCKNLTSVVIPKSIAYIGANAFGDCTDLTSVTISNGVRTIDDFAFSSCNKLTSITIPKSVKNLRESVFYECCNLKSINVDSKNKNYCSINGVLFSKDKKKLIAYPGGREGYYFVPERVQTICSYAFSHSDCNTLTIPQSVIDIQGNPFKNCKSLKNINVSSDNPNYCSVNGVLFNKDKTKLLVYPADRQGNYTVPKGIATIEQDAFYSCNGLQSIEIGNNVTTIQNFAFYSCENLESVRINSQLTTIGKHAFARCSKLTTLTIPESVTHIGEAAFDYCPVITIYTASSVSIPNVKPSQIKKIDQAQINTIVSPTPSPTPTTTPAQASATTSKTTPTTTPTQAAKITVSTSTNSTLGSTKHNKNITSKNYKRNITYNKTIKKKGIYYGINKSDLTATVLPNPKKKYQESIEIPCSIRYQGKTYMVTSIYKNAFMNCHELKSVKIPDRVDQIGHNAFCGCSSLTSITIPNGVTYIGAYAFDGCHNLKSINIPNTVVCLDEGCFGACKELTTVFIPNSVMYITTKFPFNQCTKLTTIDVAEDNPNYCSIDGILYSKDKKTIITYPIGKNDKTYEIPDGVTTISQYAFAGCWQLIKVSIPNSVTRIGKGSFLGCTNLKSITIPKGVKTIETSAFAGCSTLKSVTISIGVEIIEDRAFERCGDITKLDIPNSIKKIGSKAFANSNKLTSIIVPDYNVVAKDAFGKNVNILTNNVEVFVAVTEPEGKLIVDPTPISKNNEPEGKLIVVDPVEPIEKPAPAKNNSSEIVTSRRESDAYGYTECTVYGDGRVVTTRVSYCQLCHGSKTCTMCSGMGGHYESSYYGLRWAPCVWCNGTGENKCRTCHGTGYTTSINVVYPNGNGYGVGSDGSATRSTSAGTVISTPNNGTIVVPNGGSSGGSSSSSKNQSSSENDYIEVIEYAPDYTGKSPDVWCEKCQKFGPRHVHIKKKVN